MNRRNFFFLVTIGVGVLNLDRNTCVCMYMCKRGYVYVYIPKLIYEWSGYLCVWFMYVKYTGAWEYARVSTRYVYI